MCSRSGSVRSCELIGSLEKSSLQHADVICNCGSKIGSHIAQVLYVTGICSGHGFYSMGVYTKTFWNIPTLVIYATSSWTGYVPAFPDFGLCWIVGSIEMAGPDPSPSP